MSRVVAIFIALIAALFAAIPPGPAVAATTPAILTYSYNGHHPAAVVVNTTTECGPPAAYDSRTFYDAVDPWSCGNTARPDGPTTRATTTYTTAAALAHGARARTTSGQQVEATDRLLFAPTLSGVATNTGEDTVSLFKASQRGLGESHYASGYKPGGFPGNGAYFAKEKEIADSYATHYGEGVIETRVPRGIYEEHFAQYEMTYLGTPPGTELAIPPHMLDFLSQFERIWH